MIGARHCAGSTISNGGDSSPTGWFIVGRRPWIPLILAALILPERRSFYEDSLSVITAVLPSEKRFARPGTGLTDTKGLGSLPWLRFRYRNGAVRRGPAGRPFHPKFTLCRA